MRLSAFVLASSFVVVVGCGEDRPPASGGEVGGSAPSEPPANAGPALAPPPAGGSAPAGVCVGGVGTVCSSKAIFCADFTNPTGEDERSGGVITTGPTSANVSDADVAITDDHLAVHAVSGGWAIRRWDEGTAGGTSPLPDYVPGHPVTLVVEHVLDDTPGEDPVTFARIRVGDLVLDVRDDVVTQTISVAWSKPGVGETWWSPPKTSGPSGTVGRWCRPGQTCTPGFGVTTIELRDDGAYDLGTGKLAAKAPESLHGSMALALGSGSPRAASTSLRFGWVELQADCAAPPPRG